ncbi:MAG: alanine--glyoxylate aminotransferase family protein, partial [Candidatus Atribacteria bacterium]|nr:alanine--glyoxylate aminotransferase family protein [Candidatus Atribacteria bacterium]
LDYQLDLILEEGFKNRVLRHQVMADRVRKWAKENYELFADERFTSNTVTCIKNTKETQIKELNRQLGERGFLISDGYGKLKGKTFRIAHMGDMQVNEIEELLTVIDEILSTEGDEKV